MTSVKAMPFSCDSSFQSAATDATFNFMLYQHVSIRSTITPLLNLVHGVYGLSLLPCFRSLP